MLAASPVLDANPVLELVPVVALGPVLDAPPVAVVFATPPTTAEVFPVVPTLEVEGAVVPEGPLAVGPASPMSPDPGSA